MNHQFISAALFLWKIEEAGKILAISLLDHVIVGAPEAGCAPYFSFKEAGLL